MKIVSNLVRAAAFAAFALGASAFVPSTGGEALAQYGYSYGGPRAHYYRPAPRPAYRHRHVAPQRCVVRSRWVNTYSGPRLVKQRVCRRW